jgi:hypothetical protein
MKFNTMKQFSKFLILLTLTVVAYSCRKDDYAPMEEGVKFAVTLADQTNNAVTPTNVVISAEDLLGNQVYKNELIAVEQSNNVYTTKTVHFEPGNYKLTKFMVVDANGNALDATPMGYSQNSSLVNNPLPIKFLVQSGRVTEISPKLLATANSTPEAFGYTSFSVLQSSSFSFQMGVYTYNSSLNKFELSSASVSVISNKGDVTTKSFSAQIDSVTLNDADSYILTVSKEGYQTWTDTLTTSDLLHFYSTPFAINLDKLDDASINFVSKQDSLAKVSVSLVSSDNNTSVRVNWGDGNLQVYNPTERMMHNYVKPGTYKVRLTGNVASFTKLVMVNCQISTMNLDKASGLRSLNVSMNKFIKTLDLSKLTNLNELYCFQGSLENLILPADNVIDSIFCSSNQLSNIDLSSSKNLKKLYCDRNNLTAMDISHNPQLFSLCCYGNGLTSLDITNNPLIKFLDGRNNQLSILDISKSSNIVNLSLTENPISATEANKLLVSLSNGVKQNPRTNGQVRIKVALSTDGKAAKDALENEPYNWIVSTN